MGEFFSTLLLLRNQGILRNKLGMNSRCNNMDNSGIDVSLCVARLYVFARLLRNKNKFRPPKNLLTEALVTMPKSANLLCSVYNEFAHKI